VTKPGYLYVFAVWADGSVVTLFPNPLRPESFLNAGTSLHLPDDLPALPDGRVLQYPMEMPALPGAPTIMNEHVIAVLSPIPMKLPAGADNFGPGFGSVGRLNDPTLATRGPSPRFLKLETITLNFENLPQSAVHYELRK
jgi:hypothetical protein